MSRLQKPSLGTVGVPMELTFTIYDNQAKAVQNLTGYTGTLEIANKLTPTTSALSKAMTLVVAASGTIKATLTGANMTTIGAGLFTCQIQLNDGADDNYVIDQPEIFVRGAIA